MGRMYPSLDTKKKFESRDDFFPRAKTQHTIIRELNTELISKNFYEVDDPYSPHFVMLQDGEIYLIGAQDKTVSIIDTKTARMIGTSKERLLQALQEYGYDSKNLLHIIDGLKNNALFDNKISNRSKKMYRDFLTAGKDLSKGEKREHYHILKIIERLYATTKNYAEFRITEGGVYGVDLTKKGQEYFSQTILKTFFQYNNKTNFLGRHWKKYLFPNKKFHQHINKIDSGQSLELSELVEMIRYLLHKQEKGSDETLSDMRSRHKEQKMRSHVANFLYSMIYTEQKYNYKKIQTITQSFAQNNSFEKEIISSGLLHYDDFFYIEGIKGLSSLAIKELRGEGDNITTDLLRGRVSIVTSKLQDDIKRNIVVQEIFAQQMNQLVKNFETQGYKVIIEDFELVNKYKQEKKDNNRDISFSKEDVISIENYVKIASGIEIEDSIEKSSNTLRDNYEYSVVGLDNTIYGLTDQAKQTLQYILMQDNTKTGGNGGYADIKTRTLFSIQDKKSGETINNLSHEFQIVDMDSVNEGGLSDHNIFLDPLKSIQSKLKISSAIDTDIFVDSVSGGVEKTILELEELELWRDNTSKRPSNMPLSYIEKQLSIRKMIPERILQYAGLSSGWTYLDLIDNDGIKEKIEVALAKYLLEDQFKKGRLCWFVYDNDNVPGLSDELQKNLHSGKKSFLLSQAQGKFIDQALDPMNRKTGMYCIVGGGSNNLVKIMNNKTISGKGSFGIPNQEKDPNKKEDIMRITSPTLGGIISLGTRIKRNNILIRESEDIEGNLFTTLSSLGEFVN